MANQVRIDKKAARRLLRTCQSMFKHCEEWTGLFVGNEQASDEYAKELFKYKKTIDNLKNRIDSA